jgi:hypothetical protein
MSAKISCKCSSLEVGGACSSCSSVVIITDTLGQTLVENGKQAYVMEFVSSPDRPGCALDAALRALSWRFEVHYLVHELEGVTSAERLYQGLAVEVSEVAYDATLLQSAMGGAMSAGNPVQAQAAQRQVKSSSYARPQSARCSYLLDR